MKKIIFLFVFVFSLTLTTPSFAQGMMGFLNSSPDDAAIQSQLQEEQEGKGFLDNLSNKSITCAQLQDADFEKIGEYVMGQSFDDVSKHIAMNEMMKRMMGEKGEELMHQVMGKRFSACDPSIAFPSQDAGFVPMMSMMGGLSSYSDFGAAPFDWVLMLIIWFIIVVGIVLIVRWSMSKAHASNKIIKHDESALDILKLRYAKGEINQKEFEKMKKNLNVRKSY